MRKAGLVVWLDVPQAELARRLRSGAGRPLLASAAGGRSAVSRLVREMLARRRRAYALARMKVSVGRRSPARVAALIAAKIGMEDGER